MRFYLRFAEKNLNIMMHILLDFLKCEHMIITENERIKWFNQTSQCLCQTFSYLECCTVQSVLFTFSNSIRLKWICKSSYRRDAHLFINLNRNFSNLSTIILYQGGKTTLTPEQTELPALVPETKWQPPGIESIFCWLRNGPSITREGTVTLEHF